MPDGTILLRATEILYPVTGLPLPAQMDVRRGWYEENWAQRERQYEQGMYIEEALKVYYAPVMGVICDVSLT
jgi:hypothetical protein